MGRHEPSKVSPMKKAADVNIERLAFTMTSLVGRPVLVQMMNGAKISGLFHAFDAGTKGDQRVMDVCLNFAQELAQGNKLSGEIQNQLIIPANKYVSISAMSVPLVQPEISSAFDDKEKRDFKIDTDISKGCPGSRRELQRWNGGDDDASIGIEGNLESLELPEWDQFTTNEMLYGVKSTFDYNDYTTPLDKSKIPEHVRENAERLANEECNDGLDADPEQDDEESRFASITRRTEDASGASLFQHKAGKYAVAPLLLPAEKHLLNERGSGKLTEAMNEASQLTAVDGSVCTPSHTQTSKRQSGGSSGGKSLKEKADSSAVNGSPATPSGRGVSGNQQSSVTNDGANKPGEPRYENSSGTPAEAHMMGSSLLKSTASELNALNLEASVAHYSQIQEFRRDFSKNSPIQGDEVQYTDLMRIKEGFLADSKKLGVLIRSTDNTPIPTTGHTSGAPTPHLPVGAPVSKASPASPLIINQSRDPPSSLAPPSRQYNPVKSTSAAIHTEAVPPSMPTSPFTPHRSTPSTSPSNPQPPSNYPYTSPVPSVSASSTHSSSKIPPSSTHSKLIPPSPTILGGDPSSSTCTHTAAESRTEFQFNVNAKDFTPLQPTLPNEAPSGAAIGGGLSVASGGGVCLPIGPTATGSTPAGGGRKGPPPSATSTHVTGGSSGGVVTGGGGAVAANAAGVGGGISSGPGVSTAATSSMMVSLSPPRQQHTAGGVVAASHTAGVGVGSAHVSELPATHQMHPNPPVAGGRVGGLGLYTSPYDKPQIFHQRGGGVVAGGSGGVAWASDSGIAAGVGVNGGMMLTAGPGSFGGGHSGLVAGTPTSPSGGHHAIHGGRYVGSGIGLNTPVDANYGFSAYAQPTLGSAISPSMQINPNFTSFGEIKIPKYRSIKEYLKSVVTVLQNENPIEATTVWDDLGEEEYTSLINEPKIPGLFYAGHAMPHMGAYVVNRCLDSAIPHGMYPAEAGAQMLFPIQQPIFLPSGLPASSPEGATMATGAFQEVTPGNMPFYPMGGAPPDGGGVVGAATHFPHFVGGAATSIAPLATIGGGGNVSSMGTPGGGINPAQAFAAGGGNAASRGLAAAPVHQQIFPYVSTAATGLNPHPLSTGGWGTPTSAAGSVGSMGGGAVGGNHGTAHYNVPSGNAIISNNQKMSPYWANYVGAPVYGNEVQWIPGVLNRGFCMGPPHQNSGQMMNQQMHEMPIASTAGVPSSAYSQLPPVNTGMLYPPQSPTLNVGSNQTQKATPSSAGISTVSMSTPPQGVSQQNQGGTTQQHTTPPHQRPRLNQSNEGYTVLDSRVHLLPESYQFQHQPI